MNNKVCSVLTQWLMVRWLVALAVSALAAAALADSASSTCPNTTVNSAAATCFTLSVAVQDLSGITVDGNGNDAPWMAAPVRNLSTDSGLSGNFKVLRSSDAVYLLVTVTGGTYQASDSIDLFFDVRHNHAITTDDVSFRILRDTVVQTQTKTTASGTNPWVPASLGSEVATTSAPGSWTAEVRISAADLGAVDLHAIMGFGVEAQDPADSGAIIAWPSVGFVSTTPATTWGNLKMRFPLQYMMVLDQSGSMLSPTINGGTDSKWTGALNAADYLANTLGILQDSAYFDDQVCAATFAWGCSGSDTTAIVKACATVGTFPIGNFTADIAVPVGNNCTPIGSGLDIAFETLGTAAETEKERVVMLLSDGLHNKPSGSLEVEDLSYSACDNNDWDICDDSTVKVHTVAFGQSGGVVDEALLNQIHTHFSGSGTSYNISSNVDDLKGAFIGSLDDLFHMNFILDGSAASNFVVDGGNQRLIVIGSWATAASASTFKLQRDIGGGVWEDQSCAMSASDATVGFGVCSIDDPAPGTWRARTNADGLLSASRLFVLIDLDLRARFAVDQAIHGTGMDIILTADLNQSGLPLTNDAAHPVEVKVDIEKPEQGMGTFLSTTEPEHCRETQPRLPKINVDGDIVVANGVVVHGGSSNLAGSLAGSTAIQGDPATPVWQLAQELLDACGLQTLNRNVLASVSLYDDGTHGDLSANDGIYSLRFQNTEYEGSYIFRFNAAGKNFGGEDFVRTRATAKYVRVNVSPSHSDSGSQLVSQSGSIMTQVHFVTPRDSFGGYLGPGRLSDIKFLVSGAQSVGPVLDFNNGMYGQIIRFDSKTDTPTVVGVVQGQPLVEPDNKPGACEVLLHYLWWILVALVCVILLLLWLLIRCRYARKR
jgi:hypothetical protein